MSEASYKIVVKNNAGDVVCKFLGLGRGPEQGGLSSFSMTKRLRLPGIITTNIFGGDERIQNFLLDTGLDFIFDVHRRDVRYETDFTREFSGFHRGESLAQDEGGRLIYTSYSQGLNVFTLAEEIAYRSGTSQAQKSGDASQVAKEFLDENIGASAGVDADGQSRVRPNLTIASVTPAGTNWAGGRSFELLYDVLAEIADDHNCEWNVEDESPVDSGTLAFVLYWKNGIYGDDLRPGNLAGKKPVVFDARLGTAKSSVVKLGRQNDVTSVYARGQGVASARVIRAINDTSLLALSPWARRAVSRNWSNTNSTSELDQAGRSVIAHSQGYYDFKFEVRQTKAIRYRRDWNLGDLVLFRDYYGREFDTEIVGVSLGLAADGTETISIEGLEYA